jgi:hypothetical protein
MSLFGSGQIIKSIQAQIDLEELDSINLEEQPLTVNIRDRKTLKAVKKGVVNNIYDNFMHYIIYDKGIEPTEGQLSAYVICKYGNVSNSIWEKIKEMSATPLLDEWQAEIIAYLHEKQKLERCEVYGNQNIKCFYVNLEHTEYLNDHVSESLKNKTIIV